MTKGMEQLEKYERKQYLEYDLVFMQDSKF